MSIADELLASYDDAAESTLLRGAVPSRAGIIRILQATLHLLFPAHIGDVQLDRPALAAHVVAKVDELAVELALEIERCLCYCNENGVPPRCRVEAQELAHRMMALLPTLRRRLLIDVSAAVVGDPAARNADEILLAYPGFFAIAVHRIAHELHRLGVPLMPRIMSEYAHTLSGADIHPAATIGDAFFMDHATGIVVGETTVIGRGVKLYQGVTLGALSMPRDASGTLIRNTKRHPTVEDDVTIYANATVLGGQTVIGKGATIGGGVFLTRSIAPGTLVAMTDVRLRMGTNALEFEI